MFTEAPKPTEEQLAEIERLKASAADRLRREEESFQRCDTDGFLSQWALSIGARKESEQAKVLANGGCWRFPVLLFKGEVVATVIYHFNDGFGGINRRWKLPQALADKLGRRWVPVGRNSRVQKQLCLSESDRWFPAKAEICGSGTGLSGAASAYVGIVKLDEREVVAPWTEKKEDA